MTATQEAIDAWNIEHGLDQGFWTRLLDYYVDLLHFDFGKSWGNGVPVATEIIARFPYTMLVGMITLVCAVIVGIPTGILAATHQNTWIDNITMVVSMFANAMPGFWFSMVMVMFFSVELGWLPVQGYDTWQHYIIPCVAGGITSSAGIARQTRSSMLEVIRADYITTARAKGQTERVITYKHALRNALIPVVTQAGAIFGLLMCGTLVAETVFTIPGLGTYMVTAIKSRDYPAIQGAVIMVSIAFSVVMLLVDLLYAAVDPRIKDQFSKGG